MSEFKGKETIEEVAKTYINKQFFDFGDLTHIAERQAEQAFINGAKWQQEQINCELSELLEHNKEMLAMLETLEPHLRLNTQEEIDKWKSAKQLIKKVKDNE
jgi:hypothetical protein